MPCQQLGTNPPCWPSGLDTEARTGDSNWFARDVSQDGCGHSFLFTQDSPLLTSSHPPHHIQLCAKTTASQLMVEPGHSSTPAQTPHTTKRDPSVRHSAPSTRPHVPPIASNLSSQRVCVSLPARTCLCVCVRMSVQKKGRMGDGLNN